MIKTRLLIISDTHGLDFGPIDKPHQSADVAMHCGDLTDGSKLEEFRTAIHLLKAIDAPLKLVIAGNHDFTMDLAAFERKVLEATPPLDPELLAKEYGTPGEARRLFKDVEKDTGITFLDEGTHQFTLGNGALLTVYASPHTPALGAWGFQYPPDRGHEFRIDTGVDVVMTHGPPKGIMDYTHGCERAGCAHLFAAVARARPRIHCFGHVHEGWGARLVTWRDAGEHPTHFTAIDNDRSRWVENLAGLQPSRFDTHEDLRRKREKVQRYDRERCCATRHCEGDGDPLQSAAQTLFVNASYFAGEGLPVQRPWLVDIELPSTS